ncbi:MAG: hypothetical protein A3G18_07195 [Rhodospirillales bacterium RIFCSPLOWO2_12_FULL_58_28]|nr:MAG: hypothetical protein A3H92_00845 [Rhodospirillales bacterium RIFCSPLOWO2_02_FULL_58_16]OHC79492.1 MAG: hypothetical protein A3G18_07195 [Rhodospirillales bacterium RIFCSPLOWO2_12_FULL_58_28]
MQNFGKKLKERTRQLNLADAEVARRAGLSERRYGHYVTGRNEPNLRTLVKLCKVLETTPDKLLGFNAEGDEQGGKESNEIRARLRAASNVLEGENLIIAMKILDTLVEHQVDGWVV